jgi:hypothetical protein
MPDAATTQAHITRQSGFKALADPLERRDSTRAAPQQPMTGGCHSRRDPMSRNAAGRNRIAD